MNLSPTEKRDEQSEDDGAEQDGRGDNHMIHIDEKGSRCKGKNSEAIAHKSKG